MRRFRLVMVHASTSRGGAVGMRVLLRVLGRGTWWSSPLTAPAARAAGRRRAWRSSRRWPACRCCPAPPGPAGCGCCRAGTACCCRCPSPAGCWCSARRSRWTAPRRSIPCRPSRRR
ncbi:hypothetical protein ACFQY5_19985 [Paeniroseomonas aquatica]|uniref:hypothetical protein n=1 Tax=Paeniroseomonas aquatica TaxID=373043 RepID=UPI00360A1535